MLRMGMRPAGMLLRAMTQTSSVTDTRREPQACRNDWLWPAPADFAAVAAAAAAVEANCAVSPPRAALRARTLAAVRLSPARCTAGCCSGNGAEDVC